MNYADLKSFFEQYTGLERDALHIHAALLLYILAMGLFRKSRRSRFPWIAVFSVEIANECYDLARGWRTDPGNALAASAKDLWNTMLWPTVLLFLGRYTNWFQRRPMPPPAPLPVFATEEENASGHHQPAGAAKGGCEAP